MVRRRFLALCASMALAPMAFAQPRRVARPAWGLVGADLSGAMRYESAGAVYRDGVGVASPFQIAARAGMNLARLRVWHSPSDGWCGTDSTLAAARRARAAGLSLLLDFHYSDTWADPAHQAPPAAWAGLTLSTLVDRVYEYTYGTLRSLARAGCAPAWVQVGNEVTDGMLWPLGRISTAGWDGFAELVRAGVAACEDAAPGPGQCRPMIHIDRGGDNGGCRWFFDRLLARVPGVRAIGLSYYPWWHGPLGALSQNLADLAPRYGLPLMVVETAYPWTLGWADSTNNLVGLASQLLSGYPASPAGQAKFLGDVGAIVRGTAGGLGVCAWGAELIPSASIGSACENIALFDFGGVAQPGLAALGEAGLVR